MRTLAAAELTAIAARTVSARNVVFIQPKDRDDGTLQNYWFWDDVGQRSIDVTDAITGVTTARTVTGSVLASVGTIALNSDLTIRTCDIELSHLHATAQDVFRDFDVRLAPIQICRVYLDLTGGLHVAPAKARFVGVVDELVITTPPEGGEGRAVLTCSSRTRELTRINPDVRSHESQMLRDPTDTFYKYTAAVAEWGLYWGKKQGKVGGPAA